MSKKYHYRNYFANDIEITIPAVTNQTIEIDNSEPQTDIKSKNDIIVEAKSESEVFAEKCQYFESQIKNLTPTEHTIYELYPDKKTQKKFLIFSTIKKQLLNITTKIFMVN